MAALSAEYYVYMATQWPIDKARYWQSRHTLKSCAACGRGRRLDLHHLKYRTKTHGGVRYIASPHPWELVPLCAQPCHRWLVTPLTRLARKLAHKRGGFIIPVTLTLALLATPIRALVLAARRRYVSAALNAAPVIALLMTILRA